MLEKPVGQALVERQGLANTVDTSPSTDRNSKIIWLEPVENPDRRSSIWARIISGDRLVALDKP
jgi:putative spermidine/putrescine transport system substrate-binding protein